MNLQLTASPEHEDLVKELRNDIDKNLEPELYPNDCCIYRVHKKLRNVNEEAYTPQMVSIGPLHYGSKELANMEKIKRSYMKSFLEQRIMIKTQDKIFMFVKDKENQIRNCYAEISNLTSHEYIMMILYDAIFIIEPFIRNFEGSRDSFLSTIAIRSILISDLELLENQLPYFVLEEICKLAFCSNMFIFMEISRFYFGFFPNLGLIKLTPPFSVKHFTDWRRYTLLERYVGSTLLERYVESSLLAEYVGPPLLEDNGGYTLLEKYIKSYAKKGYTWDLPCAMKLHESGVKFKKTGDSKLLFEKHRHELQLPQLQIIDESECIFRNVMALEQCLYPLDTHICNYVYLMDCLIDTEKDVDLLVERGIISNLIADKSSTVNMFNKLCRNIGASPSCYYETIEELKKHCNSPRATLRRVYFRNQWRGTGTTTAVIALLLTVIQTICSILQSV